VFYLKAMRENPYPEKNDLFVSKNNVQVEKTSGDASCAICNEAVC
jgi:hypothetical protein